MSVTGRTWHKTQQTGTPLSLSIVRLTVAGIKIAKYSIAFLDPLLSQSSSIAITRQRTLLCLCQNWDGKFQCHRTRAWVQDLFISEVPEGVSMVYSHGLWRQTWGWQVPWRLCGKVTELWVPLRVTLNIFLALSGFSLPNQRVLTMALCPQRLRELPWRVSYRCCLVEIKRSVHLQKLISHCPCFPKDVPASEPCPSRWHSLPLDSILFQFRCHCWEVMSFMVTSPRWWGCCHPSTCSHINGLVFLFSIVVCLLRRYVQRDRLTKGHQPFGQCCICGRQSVNHGGGMDRVTSSSTCTPASGKSILY